MDMKIHANEAETVLDALRSYKKTLDFDIVMLKDKDDWHGDRILAKMEMQRETVTRVIARIEDL